MLVISRDKAERWEEYKHYPHGVALGSPDSSIHPALITCFELRYPHLERSGGGGLMAINGEDGYPDKTSDLFQRGRGVPLEFHRRHKTCFEGNKILDRFVSFLQEMTAPTWRRLAGLKKIVTTLKCYLV